MIEVTAAIALAGSELVWKAVGASGPGGQHVEIVGPKSRP
jgi:protein subunit release factor B